MKKRIWAFDAALIVLALFGLLSGKSGALSSGAEAAGGWCKYQENPVLGGRLGTCFDISLLKRGERIPDVVFLAPEEEHRAGEEQ